MVLNAKLSFIANNILSDKSFEEADIFSSKLEEDGTFEGPYGGTHVMSEDDAQTIVTNVLLFFIKSTIHYFINQQFFYYLLYLK